MTRNTRNTQRATRTNRTSKIKKPIRRALNAAPIFIHSGEGEDDVEANLAFLIELAGSDFYYWYVDILNERLEEKLGKKLGDKDEEKIQIELERDFKKESINIKKRQKLGEETPEIIPRIFHTTSTVTHFKASIDGIHIVNSYKNGLQKNRTNHFCQSFALMFIEASLFPDTKTAREYNEMIETAKTADKDDTESENRRLIHNAFIAKNYACNFIETVCERLNKKDIIDVFNNILDPPENQHHLSTDLLNIDRMTLLKNLLLFCKNLSEEDFMGSTFSGQVIG